MSLLEAKWVTLYNDPVENIVEEVAQIILDSDTEREVHVGTDAQKQAKYTDFVTAVVIINPGKGGRVFYAKKRMDFINSIQHKLYTEVGLSLEIALELCKVIDAETIQVHVDANTNVKWKSGPFHQQLAGMVAGHGFRAILKPDAWAASHVADHAVKNKNQPNSTRRQRRKKNAA